MNKKNINNSQGTEAETLYNQFLKLLAKGYEESKIKDGKFGAYMQVHIQNDGPVTIELESPPSRNEQSSNVESK